MRTTKHALFLDALTQAMTVTHVQLLILSSHSNQHSLRYAPTQACTYTYLLANVPKALFAQHSNELRVYVLSIVPNIATHVHVRLEVVQHVNFAVFDLREREKGRGGEGERERRRR